MKRVSASLNGLRYALRRPYRIALCVLVNALMLVLCVVGTGQWLLTAGAIEEAKESRVFLGTLSPAVPDSFASGETGVYVGVTLTHQDVIPDAAMEILQNSPYVTAFHEFRFRSARLPEKMYLDLSGYSGTVAYVAELREPYLVNYVSGATSTPVWNAIVWPTTYVAGNENAVKIPPGESSPNPALRFPATDTETPPPEIEGGKRYLIFNAGRKFAGDFLGVDSIRISQVVNSETGETLEGMFPETEADAGLDDLAFAERVIRDNHLEQFISVLDNARRLMTVVEIEDTEQLMMRKNELIRVNPGRWLTAEDRGKKVCMISETAANTLHLRPGDTLTLSLSPDSYEGRGSPFLGDFRILSYGEPEKYEVIGIYASVGQNSSSTTTFLGLTADTVYVPKRNDSPAFRADPLSFTFEVPKDSFDDFMMDTAAQLHDAGADTIMITPDYADVESQLDKLEQHRSGSIATALIALVAGLAIAAAELVLFWGADYATERTLGASAHTARGIYRSAWRLTALLSLPLAALALFVLSRISSDLFPFMLRTGRSLLIMGAFALAELAVLRIAAFLAIAVRDAGKFPK